MILKKCWQTDKAEILWQTSEKLCLRLSAEQATFGASFVEKTAVATFTDRPTVQLLRKHLPTALVQGILKSPDGKTLWLGLQNQKGNWWLQAKSGDAIELISPDKHSLFRLATGGKTYTKVKTVEEVPSPSDLSPLSILLPVEKSQKETVPLQPLWQREARDRLKRRIKLLKKTLDKEMKKIPMETSLLHQSLRIEILQNHLHLLPPRADCCPAPADSGLPEISFPLNPDLSPGANLSRFYHELTRLKRSRELGVKHLGAITKDLEQAQAALQTLQSSDALSQEVVEKLLLNSKLKHKVSVQTPSRTSSSQKTVGRSFKLSSGRQVLLGRSAAENDHITKHAAGSALWFHAVVGEGAHVVLPPKGGKTPPTAQDLREASILALHFSSLKNNYEGEVYVAKRGDLRKAKGAKAGLWHVTRSERLFISYTQEEVDRLFILIKD